MKIQDILLLVTLIVLIVTRRPKLIIAAGVVLCLASIPLFAKWIFFTAQHFVWFGALFILVGAVWLFVAE